MTSVSRPLEQAVSVASAGGMVVREGENPWTPAEIEAVRDELLADVQRIADEVELSQAGLDDLMRNSGVGAGDDSADAGGKVLEREQELTLARHSMVLLEQSKRALDRLADGSYGECEQCAGPIGKLRLQAFPRATWCVACKQKTERR